jgi:hypothetical protein
LWWCGLDSYGSGKRPDAGSCEHRNELDWAQGYLTFALPDVDSLLKSKAATRHGGVWGERRYSSYSFLTSALDGSEWSASRPSRALPPGIGPPVPIGQEAGWAPEPVWVQRLEEKSSASVRDQTLVIQSVVRHYTVWSTPAPQFVIYFHLISFK